MNYRYDHEILEHEPQQRLMSSGEELSASKTFFEVESG